MIYSRTGRGSFMAESLEALYRSGQAQLKARGRELSRAARRLHFDKAGFLDFCGQCWDEAESGSLDKESGKEGASHD